MAGKPKGILKNAMKKKRQDLSSFDESGCPALGVDAGPQLHTDIVPLFFGISARPNFASIEWNLGSPESIISLSGSGSSIASLTRSIHGPWLLIRIVCRNDNRLNQVGFP